MTTYRELFGTPEVRPFLVMSSIQQLAGVVAQIALGTAVYGMTGSALLGALAMFGPSFARAVGAVALMSMADRLPPRRASVAIALVTALGYLVMALPVPVVAILALSFVLGLAASVAAGVRFGLLHEILHEDGYLLGRSVLNASTGIVQIIGFACGGALLTVADPRRVLLIAFALQLAAALVGRLRLTERKPRALGRATARETMRVNRFLLADPRRRALFLATWIPNGLVVGCEALFIPYDPRAASVLYIAAAAGMLAGDLAGGRLLGPTARRRLATPLHCLLAAPYLLFLLRPPLALLLVAVACASFGYCATLLYTERLVALTPVECRGQALGLHSSGMMTLQAVCGTIAGALADHLPVPVVMALLALGSLTVTALLAPILRRDPSVTPV